MALNGEGHAPFRLLGLALEVEEAREVVGGAEGLAQSGDCGRKERVRRESRGEGEKVREARSEGVGDGAYGTS